MKTEDLMDAVASDSGLAKEDVRKVLEALKDQIEDKLNKGEYVEIPGLGIFSAQKEYITKRRLPYGEAQKIPTGNRVVEFKSYISLTGDPGPMGRKQ